MDTMRVLAHVRMCEWCWFSDLGIVSDFLERVADDLLIVDLRLGGDLTEHHHHAGLGARL